MRSLYIPLYPNNKAVVPAMFFLKTADPELITVVQELDALRTDEQAWITAIESDIERTVPIRTVRGLTISAYSENNKNALDLIENKHDELVLVADGKEPHPLLGAGLLPLGLGLWGGAGYRYKRVS
ncbi:MAG: hypothetical protein GY913_33425 [Proteobacteria bacterium]|nr:hypothetical protein [Pseudomonadota bacterium]MCP4921828.1 hypothetical protein [Pseudomonadota bacterium]